MSGNVKIDLKMNDINRILRDKGLDSKGSVQAFHTNNVMRRIVKFMPFVTGTTIKSMVNATNINSPQIIVPGPAAKFLYHGKLMVGIVSGSAYANENEPKKVVEKDLTYNTAKNALAGPYWDRRLIAAEKPAIVADLQRYIKRRSSR